MKYLIIPTLLILSACTPVVAQQKQSHLPPIIKLTFTAQEVARIDSAILAAGTWTDSKITTQWFGNSFVTFYQQVRKQMVVDSVGKKP